MSQASESRRSPVVWLAFGTLIGVGLCVACALAYFILQEINASVHEAALDEQCFFAETSRTDAFCDVWVERITTEYRAEFIACTGKGTPEDTYRCLMEKGLGP